MFAAIAGSYDLNNRLHSFGIDTRWRKHAIRRAQLQSTDVVLDVACGTGDLSEGFARAGAKRVLGVDFTPEMLAVAEDRRGRLATRSEKIAYVTGDAQALPVADASVDVISIAFGIRNVQDVALACREFRRVLRPGGRLVVLEFESPRFKPVRWANTLYSGWIMPKTAALIAGDRTGAYAYLPKSVDTFMGPEVLLGHLSDAGFADLQRRGLTFGICACYSGRVPGD
jgi:demethylmenaquinone methyltransferase/2-methoxy-6-polyprenyl-1,4-benzoquinol methylase